MRWIRPVRVMGMAIVAFAMIQGPNSAWACPNCKEAVTLQTGEAENLSSGYNWSVMFMLVVPFSMFGTGAFMVHRAVKRGSLPEF
ncbi:MAG: hypothetical protein ACLQGP_06290 [Isosphaeraceae bacterium]